MAKEKGKMTLARALKEKERISRRLASARDLFMSANCVRADEPREIDAKEAYEAMQSIQRRHVAMRKAIAVANAGVSPILAEMLVVKAELAFYTNLGRCKEVEFVDKWVEGEDGEKERRRERVVYDSFINEKKRREIIEKLTERIDDLQDEVDEYNATHFVKLVDE